MLHMALFPKHPRRCLRSGHGVPPFLGGTDTWRLLSVLPTPHGDVHDDQGPHDPTTQSMAAGEAGRQRSAGSFRWMSGEKHWVRTWRWSKIWLKEKEDLEPLVVVLAWFRLSSWKEFWKVFGNFPLLVTAMANCMVKSVCCNTPR